MWKFVSLFLTSQAAHILPIVAIGGVVRADIPIREDVEAEWGVAIVARGRPEVAAVKVVERTVPLTA